MGWWGQFVQSLSVEWAVIAAAPFTFISAVGIATALLWFLLRAFKKREIDLKDREIDNLNGRLKLRDDEISDYKRKLDGATPAEAKQRVDILETKVAAMESPRLTKTQKASIRSAVSVSPGLIEIRHDMSAPLMKAIKADLVQVFQNAGWEVVPSDTIGVRNPPPCGVGLRVIKPAALTSRQQLIAVALRSAGIECDIQQGGPWDALEPTPDAELMLTTSAS